MYPLHFFPPMDGQDRGAKLGTPNILWASEGGPKPGKQTLYPVHFFPPIQWTAKTGGAKLGTPKMFFRGEPRRPGGQTWYPNNFFPSQGGLRPGVGQTWYPKKCYPSEGGPRPGGGKLCTHYIFSLRGTAKTGGPNLVHKNCFFRPWKGQDQDRG